MKVLLLQPEKEAREIEIDNTLSAMQQLVGGYIETVHPYDDPVVLVCNEDGKFLNLKPNRALRDSNGRIQDMLVGTCFICGMGEEDFTSLSPELVEKYKSMFFEPEIAIKINGVLTSTKVPESSFGHKNPKKPKDNDKSPQSNDDRKR